MLKSIFLEAAQTMPQIFQKIKPASAETEKQASLVFCGLFEPICLGWIKKNPNEGFEATIL